MSLIRDILGRGCDTDSRVVQVSWPQKSGTLWPVAPTRRPLPADCVPEGTWPENLPSDTAPDVRLAAAIARRLQARVDVLTLRKAEERTGISRSTINKVTNGRTWPTIHTIANLEAGLKVRLWGKEHRSPEDT